MHFLKKANLQHLIEVNLYGYVVHLKEFEGVQRGLSGLEGVLEQTFGIRNRTSDVHVDAEQLQKRAEKYETNFK